MAAKFAMMMLKWNHNYAFVVCHVIYRAFMDLKQPDDGFSRCYIKFQNKMLQAVLLLT